MPVPTGSTVLRLRPDRTQRLEALLVGAGPHLEAVEDIGTAGNGDLLVVLPAPAARLPALLEVPGGLAAGEAVTVLAPLAGALRRMHTAGVAHGGIRADAVVLDADGSPSWTAPIAPSLLSRVGPAAFAARVEEDVAGYRALAAGLLQPVGSRLPDGLQLDGLEAALFDVARPEPVRLTRPAVAVPIDTPARLLPAARAAAPDGRASARPDVQVSVPVGRGLDALRFDGRRLVAAALRQVRTVRPRVWAALGSVGALLVIASVLLPAGGDAAPAAPTGVAATTPASSSASARAAARAAASAAPATGRADDPAAAITGLLTARESCLTAASDSCIRRVDAAGSPVLEADLRALRAGVEAVRADPAKVHVDSAGGGTALARVGGVTVLAIRDRNGWRLRDVVAEPPAER